MVTVCQGLPRKALFAAGGNLIRVLIVDSYTLYAEALQQTLERSGIERVSVTALSAAAVDEARVHSPEVVLVDLAYADGKGLELGKQIAAHVHSARVLAMISPHDARHERAALHAGFHGCITKDTSPARFVKTVRDALDRKAIRVEHPRVGTISERASDARKADTLTAREREALSYLVTGMHNRAIAKRMGISAKTVRSHVYNILTKLQVHSRLAAATLAAREGLVAPFPDSRDQPRGA